MLTKLCQTNINLIRLRKDKSYLEQDQRDNLIQISDMEEEIRNLDKMLGRIFGVQDKELEV